MTQKYIYYIQYIQYFFFLRRTDFYGIRNMETLILRENQIEVEDDMFFENDSFFDKFKV